MRRPYGNSRFVPRMNEKTRFMLALIAPAALVLLCFQVVPILTGANASFRDWTLYDPKKTWVGLANYIHVLRDAEFLQIVLPNTFGFMVATVALSLVLGLMIALVLNKRFAGRWLVQSFVLLPLMVAPVIAAIMIRWMFNDQFGVVNAVLEGLGFAPISWLTQRWTAFLVILLTDVWLWTPWFALILLAGLQSLPPEPFEAAQIDAAGCSDMLKGAVNATCSRAWSGSEPGAGVVATITPSRCRARCSRVRCHHSSGRPRIGRSTLAGSRVEFIRAWVMAMIGRSALTAETPPASSRAGTGGAGRPIPAR